ncbi:MAG: hypothetical protein Q9198_007926, partial [Flavoplaca austrocitrina]
MALEIMAEDAVAFGSVIEGEDYTYRARAKWTAADTKHFSYDDGRHFLFHPNKDKTTEENIVDAKERVEKKTLYENDLRKWKDAFYNDGTMTRKPLPSDPKYK